MAFVGEAPHLEAMDALRRHMGDVNFIRWKVEGSDVPPTWADAMQRAEARSA